MVFPARGILKRFFFACSPPLRMASGTSFALPRPAPTCPCPSPTTTSAEKLNRRPPLTTLATRLMLTTRSFSSGRSFGLIGAAIEISLELQAALAGALGDRSDAAVVVESVAVEHDRGDLRGLAFLRHQLADLLGQLALLALPVLELRRERRRRRQRLAGRVVDHLGVDVVEAAVDGQARPLRAARHLDPDARLAPFAQVALLLDAGFAHGPKSPPSCPA